MTEDNGQIGVLTLRAWVAAIGLCLPGLAAAQATDTTQGASTSPATLTKDASPGDEIIVTARRRDESAYSVPVSITALGSKELERYGTRDLQALTSRVPGLVITPSSVSGSITLRGVTTIGQNPSGDQAVSLNVDGVQVGSVQLIRLAQIDLQQIEVLKGPQALFFGKNSTAGIVSIRSADPGDELEVKASTGYEFAADEAYGQLVVSAPLSDNVGVRGVAYGSTRKGWLHSIAVPIPGVSLGPVASRVPNDDQLFFRGTVLARPTSSLTVRGKYSYAHLSGTDPLATTDRFACANGTPQVLGLPLSFECRLDDKTTTAKINPVLAANSTLAGEFKQQGITSTQHLASMEVSYDVAPKISFVSLTGLYSLNESFRSNLTYAPTSLLIGGSTVHRRELSQEVRLTTSREDWPLNFMIGGYAQNTKFNNEIPLVIDRYVATRTLPLGTPLSSNISHYYIDSSTYSVFGQVIAVPLPKLELAGGVRRSWEKKRLKSMLNGMVVPGPAENLSFKDTSPEATITWHPYDRFSVFGAYRRGFKSGGFNSGGQLVGVDLSYRPETVEGFEVGTKLESGPVKFDASAYTYEYKGLQVSGFDPARVANTVFNAGAARVKGIEADITWRPALLRGFDLHGAVNYNHARYKEFLITCYVGQTIAEGCAFTPNAAGRFQQQNLRGKPLLVAPDWTGSVGTTYEHDLRGQYKVSFNVDAVYSGSFQPILEQAPLADQKKYVFLNASAKLASGSGWEASIVGRNLTDIYRSFYAAQVPLTGNAALTGTNTVGGKADILGQISRGRQVSLDLAYRF